MSCTKQFEQCFPKNDFVFVRLLPHYANELAEYLAKEISYYRFVAHSDHAIHFWEKPSQFMSDYGGGSEQNPLVLKAGDFLVYQKSADNHPLLTYTQTEFFKEFLVKEQLDPDVQYRQKKAARGRYVACGRRDVPPGSTR